MRNPRYLAVGLLSTALLSIGAATAQADDSVTLDFVRHGESGDMTAVNTLVPGPELTDTRPATGAGHRQRVGGQRHRRDLCIRHGQVAGDRSSLGRCAAFPDPGLARAQRNRCGHFRRHAGERRGPATGRRAVPARAGLAWTLGLDFVPQLGSTIDPNGIAFDESFSGAVQSIYDGSVANDTGDITDAVFSHEGAIAIWTLMNVNNPDFSAGTQRIVQHRRTFAVHRSSRGRRLTRGLDTGQLGRDAGAAGSGPGDRPVRRLPRA